ncbi:MAG: glycosyltransferase family 2 protein [Bacteroidota bacterium]
MNHSITVITVVYNGKDLLEGTIKSVLHQTYPHVEYVVVDGNSKDGTQAIIQRYADQIDQWVSEPDKGLYDAMNKGLRMATGDFVLFMNAGDEFRAPDVLENVFAKATAKTDVLYGEVMFVNEAREDQGTRSENTTQKTPEALHWKSLKYGMVVSHQAFIPRRTIAPPYIENNLTADIDWVIKCLKQSQETINTQVIIADYLMGGLSVKRHRQSMKDRFAVLAKHYGVLPNLFNHAFIVWRALMNKR